MDKQEIERRLEAAEKQNIVLLDEIKNLKEKLADMQDEQEIPDFPEFAIRETYWYAASNLNDIDFGCAVCNTADDYNNFHSKDYADEFRRKCLLIAMMLHCKWYLCRDFKENFEDDECKWYVYYANNTSHFAADYCVNDDHGSVYFDTEESAQKCADWLNEHWRENNE